MTMRMYDMMSEFYRQHFPLDGPMSSIRQTPDRTKRPFLWRSFNNTDSDNIVQKVGTAPGLGCISAPPRKVFVVIVIVDTIILQHLGGRRCRTYSRTSVVSTRQKPVPCPPSIWWYLMSVFAYILGIAHMVFQDKRSWGVKGNCTLRN